QSDTETEIGGSSQRTLSRAASPESARRRRYGQSTATVVVRPARMQSGPCRLRRAHGARNRPDAPRRASACVGPPPVRLLLALEADSAYRPSRALRGGCVGKSARTLRSSE